MGRRRRRSKLPVGRLLVLLIAVGGVVRLITLPDPDRPAGPSGAPLAVVPDATDPPTWAGPAAVTIPGTLPDGTDYLPRLYLNPETSVGIAPSPDGDSLRIVIRGANGRVTELRRLGSADQPEFDGFSVTGDTLVWAESVSRSDEPVTTTIWRANWRTGSRPAVVTGNTGAANFFGGQYDILPRPARVYWAALAPGNRPVTEIRSVPVGGGQVTIQRLDGEFALSAWPWAVSASPGQGTPVRLVNLTTNQRIEVPTQPGETAACDPRWCRMSVVNQDTLVRMDMVRVDRSDRRRISGSEATPTIPDVTVLDRFVPLATDRGNGQAGVGLSLYDVTTGRTELVALDAANVGARNGILWWSTGSGADLRWNAVDLRALT